MKFSCTQLPKENIVNDYKEHEADLPDRIKMMGAETKILAVKSAFKSEETEQLKAFHAIEAKDAKGKTVMKKDGNPRTMRDFKLGEIPYLDPKDGQVYRKTYYEPNEQLLSTMSAKGMISPKKATEIVKEIINDKERGPLSHAERIQVGMYPGKTLHGIR